MKQHSKVYRWGVRKRGKIGKHGKIGVKRKWWILAQLPYYPQGNGRQVIQGGTMELRTRRKTQRAGKVKGCKDKRDPGRIPDTFM